VVLGGTLATGDGVWFGPSEALQAIALPGAALPASLESELGDGTFGNFVLGDVGINTAGEIAFNATIVASGGGSRATLVAGTPDALRVVARERESQQEEGFITFDGSMVLNAAGDVAFLASDSSLEGPPGLRRALWMTHDRGAPFPSLAEGRAAPGLDIGEVVTFIEGGPYMNAAGQAVVLTGIGPAGGAENTVARAFWRIDPESGAELVVREGGSIVLDGESRTVNGIGLVTAFAATRSGGEDGRPSILDTDGRFVFHATLEREAGGFESAVLLASPTDGGTCGDPSDDGDVSATDALSVLLAAVELDTCALCICDVDQSGSVSATDALATLQAAVGTPGVTLSCPDC
jgi:hypothetical protein